MNVNEHYTFHSEKSAPITQKHRGLDETLNNNQSAEGKTNFPFKKGVKKTFSGFSKAIAIAFFMLFSLCIQAQQTVNFNYTGNIENWTVPSDVICVTIETRGAQGGSGNCAPGLGGSGAIESGTFSVTPSEQLKILVGQKGFDGTISLGGDQGGGGGGGGTFVTKSTNVPLIIAGGGGGYQPTRFGCGLFAPLGIDANSGTSGSDGFSVFGNCPTCFGVGGIGGNGATNGPSPPAAGNGGGLLTPGAPASIGNSGASFIGGGAGGISITQGGNGGFGGGGSGDNTGGGGGGGYSGGGGSWDDPTNGGGGGSFNAGMNQLASIGQTGNGLVLISYSPFGITCPGNMTYNLGSGECSKQVNFSPQLTGSCGNAIVTCNPPSGSDFPIGLTIVTCQAVENGITVTCTFTITVVENVPDETSLSCHGLINSSLDENCQITVTPGMILTGNDYSCFDDYTVMVKPCKTCPPIPGSPIIDGGYIGDTLVAEVCDESGDNCCWGYIVPEDKKKPTICCADFSMNCNDDTHPDSIFGITKTYEYDGIQLPIPDESESELDSVCLYIDVECDSFEIIDFTVNIDITHTSPTDLTATITSPDGMIFPVILPTPTNLPALIGKNASGTWKITIFDNVNNASTGTVHGASLEIEADYAHPVAIDNCDDNLPPPTYTDTLLYTNCDSVCYQKIKRTWCVTDASLNTFCCDQFICLTRPDFEDLVCPPDYDGSCPDDPLESLWLQDILAGCADNSCGAEVRSCTYQGEPVIEVTLNPIPNCSDPYYSVYKCSGEHLFDYGGVFAINLDLAADLMGCTVIYKCGDFLPHPTKTSVLSCTDTFPTDANGHPDPIFTGRPKLDGSDVDGFCMFYCIYEDDVIPICEGSYIIVREWECWDWCTGEDTTCQQIIKIMDNDPPEIICPPDMTLNAGDDCEASTILPPPDLTDVCSPTGTSYSAFVLGDGDLSQSNGNWILSNIPIGTTTVCYAGIDGCGNKDTCYFDVTVIDNTPPVAKCKPWRSISISNDSSYCTASHFDDGSYDECSSVSFMVRRFTNPNCTPPEGQETDFGPEVYFYCCDVGDTIAVELKVTDAAGLMNFCTSYMIVEDNLAPIHTYCPPDTSVACTVDIGDYNNTGGEPDFFDNCELDTIIVTNDSMLFSCGLGMVFRKWVAIDVYGNRDSCEQKITLINEDPFDGNTDIDWPDDTTISCEANTHPDSLPVGSQRPIPDSNGACENVTVSGPIDVMEDAENSTYCYQIRRTWTVTDSCFIDINGFVVPKDYFHDQIIKITDDEAPTFDCPDDVSVDPGDNVILIVTSILDNCSDQGDITVTYDIDQDYVSDPFVPDVINQSGPNASGVAGDVNYPAPDCGEDDRIHRVRFIVQDTCHQSDTCYVNVTVSGEFTCDNVKTDPIVINVGASSGDTKLIANNALTNSFIYTCDPPDGIKLSFDGNGPGTDDLSFNCDSIVNNEPTLITVYFHLPNGEICERNVNIIDNTSPVLSCAQSLTIPTNGAPGPVSLGLFQDLLISELGDNCTMDTADLIIVYDPPTLPCGAINEIVTITVKDLFNHVGIANDGNPIECDISVTIDCSSPPTFNVSGGIENEEGDDVEYVAVEVESDNMQDVAMTGDDGAFGFNLPSNESYEITPERDDNILNGVSTYDLVLMSKHILQFDLLPTPYKIIAADVNHSGTVSTIDMVALRKVILFIDDEFPNNTSWRFVDAEFVFPDPTNPFSTSFPEVYTIDGLVEDEIADFVGVKIGDVNCSASPNDLVGSGDDRNADGELVLTLSDQSLIVGETYQVDFEATVFDQVQGFQFTMNFDADAIEFNDLAAGDLNNISSGNFGLHKLNEGIITASWNTLEAGQTLENGKVLFSFSLTALKGGQLSDLININSRFTKAEAYNQQGLLDLSLQFVDESGTITSNKFELYQNQPNPFKDETVIGFYLPESGKAKFKVFDISGRVLKSVEGEYSKGYNEISINRSELQSSGVLYYQLESAEHIASKKMVLLD